jgi:peroxiredoxin
MELTGWLARTVLAVVFVIAAVAKARDQADTRTSVAAFGVPDPAAPVVAVLLPIVELTAAALLMVPGTAVVGAALACLLLLAFTLAVARLLLRGERPACRCFGQVSSDPIGVATLVRNLVLLAVGVVGLVQAATGDRLTPAEAVERLGRGGVAAICGVIVVAGLVLFCRELLVQNGRILARLDVLETRVDAGPAGEVAAAGRETQVGRPAPSFTAPDLDGRGWTTEELVGDRPLLLFFLAANCAPCDELLPDLTTWIDELAERASLRVVVSGDAERARVKAADGLRAVALLDPPDHISPRYGAPGTPSAVLIDPELNFASEVAAGRAAIEGLVESVRRLRPPPPGPGQPAPAFAANDRVGAPWQTDRIAELGGRVLVFWDPACGWCERLLPDLLGRELDGRIDEFVVVSTGPSPAIADLPFRSPVLVDSDRQVANAFGVTGTPIAVRVDRQGLVASRPAAGGPAVLELLSTSAAGPGSAAPRS